MAYLPHAGIGGDSIIPDFLSYTSSLLHRGSISNLESMGFISR